MSKAAFAALPFLLLATACSPPAADQPETPATPIAPVAPEPAAPTAAEPQSLPPLNPPAPGQPGGLPDDRTPLSEGPIQPGSAQDAANVVQTYYALLGEGRYTQAWALWDNGGKASGMSAQAFADSFRRYSEYHANVGGPGRIDAGAGQRHVDVPVQVYGRLRDGGQPFNMLGKVKLHRVADVPGATAEQTSWRISDSSVKPRPNAPMPAMPDRPRGDGPRGDGPRNEGPRDQGPPQKAQPDRITANYRCDGDLRLTVEFDNGANTATVRSGRRDRVVLKGQPTGSGIHYAGQGHDLRGKGDDATWTAPGAKPVACKAR